MLKTSISSLGRLGKRHFSYLVGKKKKGALFHPLVSNEYGRQDLLELTFKIGASRELLHDRV